MRKYITKEIQLRSILPTGFNDNAILIEDNSLIIDCISCKFMSEDCYFSITNNVPYINSVIDKLKNKIRHISVTSPLSFRGFQWTH
ncbi:hypothetical protein PORY_001555 [Pneumocystis oryctolagi]|uniref:Uncharacterized protein n=1 Tax=Pneumocystis oryctolagi TaxID=42067 RepID=A0ACB7CBM0_9ASCO|nr:hypothetical protein PORY_001555 [Pneumocystis oryctolagi]